MTTSTKPAIHDTDLLRHYLDRARIDIDLGMANGRRSLDLRVAILATAAFDGRVNQVLCKMTVCNSNMRCLLPFKCNQKNVPEKFVNLKIKLDNGKEFHRAICDATSMFHAVWTRDLCSCWHDAEHDQDPDNVLPSPLHIRSPVTMKCAACSVKGFLP